MTLLELHVELAQRLTAESEGGNPYRDLLENVVGLPLDCVRITTAEHAAPYNRASTISFVLPQLALQQAGLVPPATILVLAASLVPMDNSHYPRGFYLPYGDDRSARFNLVPQSFRKTSPLLRPPAPATALRGAAQFVQRHPWLRVELENVSVFPTYAHQIAACMQRIVGRWAPDASPGCVQVRPLEEVARRFLIDLLARGDWALHRLLFDADIRRELARELHGVFCAWGDRQGSFLFWGARDGRVVRLREEGHRLVGESMDIPLEPDAVRCAMSTGTLLPGVFLSLLAVSYFPNLRISGGPKQLQYFQHMIAAANRAGAGSRSLELSMPGYMSADFTQLRPRRDAPGIPDFGTGLALASQVPDMSFLIDQMARIPVREYDAIQYRYA